MDRLRRWIFLAAVLLALAAAARGLERHNTWYLASDQFAFLTFAHDLRQGRIFHRDFSWELIAPRDGRTHDALAQTYLWRDGRLYSRYPPGFPALLALAGAVGGERGEHLLNPLLFLLILVVVARVPAALLPTADRRLAAPAGAAAAWLLLLVPTGVHLWGLTLARDLPAHLLGLLALLAAARGRLVTAGAALGLAAVIRPDAVLYGVSIGLVAAIRRAGPARLAFASLAFFAAASPLFLYNWVTGGHPLAFSQGGEFVDLLSSLRHPPRWAVAQAFGFPSGRAFRLSHLGQTLPGNLRLLAGAFGWMALGVAVGAAWAARRRPLVPAALLPYAVTATLFYSFWSHPDTRYLVGVSLCLLPLAGLGLAAAATRIVEPRASPAWAVAAIVIAAAAAASRWGGVGWAWVPPPRPASVTVALSLGALGAASLLGLRRPGVAALAALLPALVLAGVGVATLATSRGRRDPFQRPQVERARRTLGALVPAGSLVLTTTDLGRPAENITHYLGVRALYTTEPELLRVRPVTVVVKHLLRGRHVFYLLDARDRYTLSRLPKEVVSIHERARRRGMALLDWFVDPRRVGEAVLWEVELAPRYRRLFEDLARKRRGGGRRSLRRRSRAAAGPALSGGPSLSRGRDGAVAPRRGPGPE